MIIEATSLALSVFSIAVAITAMYERTINKKNKDRQLHDNKMNDVIRKAILPHNMGKDIDEVRDDIVRAGLNTDFNLK